MTHHLAEHNGQPETAAAQPFVKDVFQLPTGQCVLFTPKFMTPEDVEDLGDWLELILRSAKRAASADQARENS